MKKLVSFCLLSVMGIAGAQAAAKPGYLKRNTDGSYNVTYNYTDKAKTGWYIGGRAELSFLNWENKYSSDDPMRVDSENSDEYSFETVMGGNVSVGRTFNYFWRGEIEAGLLGQFSDKDQGVEFKMTVPYVIANGYYDFANGMYVGAGVGLALPKTEFNWAEFVSGERSERAISPMGALMFGWSHELDTNLVFDARYRLAGFVGPEHTRGFSDGVELTVDTGFVLDNSLSMGLRYRF